MSRLSTVVLRGLARRGFTLQRHPGWRRQRLLTEHGVDVVLDVGAARGGYAHELRQFGYAGRIVSFEPMAAAFADLRAAATGDPAWTCVHSALGSTAGRQTINIASNSDSSSILPMADEHRSAAPHVDYVGEEEITVARLDDVAHEHLSDTSRPFLKIDTQGFEAEVLAGGAQTLDRCVGLQLELSFVPLYSGGMLVDEAISFAYDHGFRMVALAQGFTHPTGAMLQADGVFFREPAATP
jgi:FkbM family methyltransferase